MCGTVQLGILPKSLLLAAMALGLLASKKNDAIIAQVDRQETEGLACDQIGNSGNPGLWHESKSLQRSVWHK